MVKIFVFVLSVVVSNACFAESEVSFPADWKDWMPVTTPLTKIGALPGCDFDSSSLPPIYQETVETYCSVRPEGPGAVAVLVTSSETKAYQDKLGKMQDGPVMILHLKELSVLFVTGYKEGKPTYGAYKEDGTDIASVDPSSPLSMATCRTCHTGYEAFCVNGQCASSSY